MQNYVPMRPKTLLKNNRYWIKAFLTAGGFGAVYVAEDTVLQGRLCVLKESFDQTPEGRAQFEVEAATLSTLNHPHLVRVTDNFIEPSHKGQTHKMYLAMEYVEGEDLQDILERSPAGLPEQQVLEWMDQILDAVAYCHAFNPRVIHRDIKPSNIRIRKSDGKAVLVDFGIAKIGGKLAPTRDAARGVSDGYSPPEQYGTGTDTYSDVYALGATLYHLLTGRRPDSAVDIARSAVVLTRPRSLNPSISPVTEQVILTAMQLLTQDRYPTAGDMRLALQGKLPTVCPHCGAAVRAGARFCQACGRSTVPVKPLVFRKSGHRARTVAELVQGCDSFWDEARDLLWRGEIESWLATSGESALAQRARDARARHSDPSAGLEEFLGAAAPARPQPILSVRPDPLDCGRAYKGDTRMLTLTIANSGRGYLHGQVSADPPAWLSAQPAAFGCLAGVQQPVQVEVNTASLSGDELGTEYGGRITVQSNRGAQTIPVKLVVMDPPRIAVAPDRLDAGTLPFGAQAAQAFTLSNQGGGTLPATVRAMDDWIVLLDAAGRPLGSAVSAPFALKRGQGIVINLAVDSGRLLARGQHAGALRIEAANALTPVVTVPVTVTVGLPYLLDPADPASAIRDRDGLWRWCDEHWERALKHLAAGRLEACLRFMGETKLAQEAARRRQLTDPNVGLETLLRACDAPPPQKWETNAADIEGDLGFGLLPRLGKKPDVLTFKILNKSARGYLHGYVDPVASWLSIPQPRFGCRPGEIAEVVIHADHKARRRSIFSAGEQLLDIVVE